MTDPKTTVDELRQYGQWQAQRRHDVGAALITAAADLIETLVEQRRILLNAFAIHSGQISEPTQEQWGDTPAAFALLDSLTERSET